jgi:hypothetical protein
MALYGFFRDRTGIDSTLSLGYVAQTPRESTALRRVIIVVVNERSSRGVAANVWE